MGKKIKKIFNLKAVSLLVLFVGLTLWGIVFWELNQAKYLKIGGSSDMIRRTMAINEAIKSGEKSYSFETNESPAAPMGLDSEVKK